MYIDMFDYIWRLDTFYTLYYYNMLTNRDRQIYREYDTVQCPLLSGVAVDPDALNGRPARPMPCCNQNCDALKLVGGFRSSFPPFLRGMMTIRHKEGNLHRRDANFDMDRFKTYYIPSEPPKKHQLFGCKLSHDFPIQTH